MKLVKVNEKVENMQEGQTVTAVENKPIARADSAIADNSRAAGNEFWMVNNAGQAEDTLRQLKVEQGAGAVYARDVLETMYKLADALLDPGKNISGDADDFHNLSVSMLRLSDDYETAFEIVELGLKIHGQDTDLMADAIRYGTNCGKRDRAEEWYGRLTAIPYEKWTWRAFSFVIDYLLEKYVSDGTQTDPGNILALAKTYQQYHPYREDAYYSEYLIYRNTNQQDKAVKVLQSTIVLLGFCPKIWLRYADTMVERGNYEEAAKYVRNLRVNPQSSESVNMAYVYYLDAVCRSHALLEKEEHNQKEEDAMYKAMDLAVNHPSCREDTKEKVETLRKTMELELRSI